MGRLLSIVLVTAAFAGCGDSNGSGARDASPAPDLADLTITSATVERVSPESCFGNEICLIVTIANIGTAGATDFSDGCGTSSFGDPEPWAPYVTNGIIPAGSTIRYRAGYAGLGEHLPATFTLFCEVDAADRVDESDETNNTYTATVSLESETDLAILSATVERVADPDTCGGSSLCLVVAVANWGPVDATGVSDGCGTPTFGDPEPWAAYAEDSVIPADSYVTFRAGYQNLAEHLPATFTLVCAIDAEDRFDEPNETNNHYTTEVTL